jgi:hypothetical protein
MGGSIEHSTSSASNTTINDVNEPAATVRKVSTANTRAIRKQNSIASASSAKASSRPTTAKALLGSRYAMLSYQWDHQETVKRARSLLEKEGVKCWMVRCSFFVVSPRWGCVLEGGIGFNANCWLEAIKHAIQQHASLCLPLSLSLPPTSRSRSRARSLSRAPCSHPSPPLHGVATIKGP